MKVKYKKSLVALIGCALLLTGCNQYDPDEIIEVGFDECHGFCNYASQFGIALTCKREQELNAEFNIYIGAIKLFEIHLKNDGDPCNPGYGKFAIERVIFDEKDNMVQSGDIVEILDDFPSFDKYPLIQEDIEGTYDGYVDHYSTYVVETFDFESVDLDSGFIGYCINYYDDIHSKIMEDVIIEYARRYGADLDAFIHFEKKDDKVIFKTSYELSKEHGPIYS